MRNGYVFNVVAVILLATGCSSDGPNNSGGSGDGGPTTRDSGQKPPQTTLSFLSDQIDVESAGAYTAIAENQGRIGVAYYRTLTESLWRQVTCPATFSGGGGLKARPGYDLYYVESRDSGVSWSAPVKVDQSVGAVFGLSMAMSGASVHIGYICGEMGQQTCASSDACVSASDDGQAFTSTTLYRAGPVGDTVGHWTSVAIDPQGQVQAAYRDVLFGFYQKDDGPRSALRYGGSGETVDDEGAGTYATLKFDSQARPVIMHFNQHQTGGKGGIQVAVKQGAQWSTQQVVAGGTAEKPDFDGDGNGSFGLAYFEPAARSLLFVETGDLSTWSAPVHVDASSFINGEHASLAYDSQGNPGISYYRCGPAGTNKCDAGQDGLMYAYRSGGSWKTWLVDDGGAYACGDHTALTFDSQDNPVIAYRCVMLRNQDNSFVETLKVARGVRK